MQHLVVSGAVRHIYIYVVRQLRLKRQTIHSRIAGVSCHPVNWVSFIWN